MRLITPLSCNQRCYTVRISQPTESLSSLSWWRCCGRRCYSTAQNLGIAATKSFRSKAAGTSVFLATPLLAFWLLSAFAESIRCKESFSARRASLEDTLFSTRSLASRRTRDKSLVSQSLNCNCFSWIEIFRIEHCCLNCVLKQQTRGAQR